MAASDRSKLAHAAGRLCANITRNSGQAWTMFDPSTKRCRSLAIDQTYARCPIAQTRIGKSVKESQGIQLDAARSHSCSRL
jgi:hypothetical protein